MLEHRKFQLSARDKNTPQKSQALDRLSSEAQQSPPLKIYKTQMGKFPRNLL